MTSHVPHRLAEVTLEQAAAIIHEGVAVAVVDYGNTRPGE